MHLDIGHTAELLGVGLGLHSVWALSNGQRLGWLTSIASVVFATIVYLLTGLWGQVGLMAVFATLSISGWLAWERSTGTTFVTLRATRPVWLYSTLATAILFPLLWWVLTITNDPAPLLDATVTTLSLVAVYWQTKRWAENWWLWAIVNVASVLMYWQTAQWAFLLYYLALLLMCIRGWLAWKAMLPNDAPSTQLNNGANG